MPYIGKQLVRGQNRKLDDISSGFNGSQTTFTLQVASQNVTVGSALQLWISLGGVIQDPLSDYTIAGNQITFTTAPAASLDFFGVIQGDVTDTNTPGDATVTSSKLSTGLTVNLANGSAATSSLQLGGTDSGLFSSAADKVNVTTGGVERLEIGSSEVVFNDPSNDVDFRVESNGNANMLFVDAGNDRVGIGTSSPSAPLHLNAGTTNDALFIDSSDAVVSIGLAASDGAARLLQISGGLAFRTNGNANTFGTGDSERMRIDSSGNVGIGTTSPDELLHVANTGGGASILIETNASSGGNLLFGDNSSNTVGRVQYNHSDNSMRLHANGSERLRIDSSGRLLIGISSSRNVGFAHTVQIEGTDGTTSSMSLIRNSNDNNGPHIDFAKSRGTSTGSNTVVQSGDTLGNLVFRGVDGSDANTVACQIQGQVDGTPGSNDMPGRLVFKTTADGASSASERLRISQNGNVSINTTSSSNKLRVHEGSDTPNVVIVTGADESSEFLALGVNSGVPCVTAGGVSSTDAALAFRTADNGTESEAARFDKDGRLLVGTTSALMSDAEKKLQMTHANAGAGIVLGRNDTTVTAGNTLGGIEFVGNDSNGTYQQCAKIEAKADGTHQNDDKSTRLSFSVTAGGAGSSTERMRINNAGQASIFRSGASGQLQLGTLDASTFSSNENYMIVYGSAANNYTLLRGCNTADGTPVLDVEVGGTRRIEIESDGDIFNTNGTYGTISDARLKENIVDASSQWDDVKDLQVRNFNFTEASGLPTNTQIGFVAQEVEQVSPGLVKTNPDLDQDGNDLGTTTKSVKTSVLLVKAIKALQEAMDRIETLEAKVAALEAE